MPCLSFHRSSVFGNRSSLSVDRSLVVRVISRPPRTLTSSSTAPITDHRLPITIPHSRLPIAHSMIDDKLLGIQKGPNEIPYTANGISGSGEVCLSTRQL